MRAPGFRREESAERLSISLFVAGVWLAFGAGLAGAEDPDPAPPSPPTPPARSVGQVTATATRAERDVLDVAGNVTVIDRETIEKSGARDVPELLRRESGLYVSNDIGSPEGYRVEARGFNNGGGNGSALLVLVDGRRLNEADSSFVDWSLVHLDRVERIEIVRGPGSALYGDNAMGGVVHIITRDGAGAPNATLAGRFGSYQEATGSLLAGASQGPFTGSFYVDGYTSDGFRKHSDYDSHMFSGKLRWTPNDASSFELSSGYSADHRKRPGTLTQDEIDDLGRHAREPFSNDYDSAHERWVQGLSQIVVAEDVKLELLPYWRSRSDSGAFKDEDPAAPFDFGFDTDTNSWGGSGQIEVDRPIAGFQNRAILGFEFLRDDVDRTSLATSAFCTPGCTGDTDVHRSIWSGFAQEEFSILESLLLSAGLRYDTAWYSGNSLSATPFGTTLENLKRTPTALSPRAGLTWRFLDATAAYFSYTRGFRFPNFDESIGFDGDLFDLSPQRSNSYEIGLKQRSETLSANLAFYWMDVKDEIFFDPLVLDPVFGFLSAQNTNLERVRHRGIELWTDWRPLPWLELYGSYTLNDTRIEKDPITQLEGERMPLEPLHHGTTGLYLFLPWRFEFGLNANLVGRRHVSNNFGDGIDSLPFYYTLGATLAWRMPVGEHLEIGLLFRALNLTDQKYSEVGGAPSFGSGPVGFNPAPGRNFEGGVTVSWQ
ncbi:MAG TPA: TonB-dependent receptor [Myxococcota bacterium]|jgi:iron complex outermembrane receptor protein